MEDIKNLAYANDLEYDNDIVLARFETLVMSLDTIQV